MRRRLACTIAGWALLLMGCGSSGAAVPGPSSTGGGADPAAAPADGPGAPTSEGGEGTDAGVAIADADAAPPVAPPVTPADPAFHARLLQMIHAVVGDDYASQSWDSLFSANVPFAGTHAWVPGTGERTADDPAHSRAMSAVPDGLMLWGIAVDLSATTPSSTGPWLGISCSQSQGGAEFAKLSNLSALEVFATAWSDAKSLLTRLGPAVHGAWIVGHSAGALPALLAGLVGGAHRIDVYGVPSAVGTLMGDDGIAHLHTHMLDPAGTMGFIDPFGHAQIDPLSAAATLIKAGGSFSYHDYASWPAPAP